ncbi:hypothetical protein OIO90_001232 [Microbotryomycetes sp. JL221]|nr:hypothetical protein OIO90_001232 [Microbotryomycetes sp. JL221]
MTTTSPNDGSSSVNNQIKSTKNDNSMLSDVIQSIFEPGTNQGLIKAMTLSFYSLFVTLFGLICLTKGNLHVVCLLLLSIGLFVSIKWFLIQIRQAELEAKERDRQQQQQQQQSKDNLNSSTYQQDDKKHQ